jgi:hypothetical protein
MADKKRTPLIQPGSFLAARTTPPAPEPGVLEQIIEADRESGGREALPEEQPEVNKLVNKQTSKLVNMFTSLFTKFIESPGGELIPYTCRVDKSIPIRLQRAALSLKEQGKRASQQSLVNAILLAGLEQIEQEIREG